MTAWDPQRYLNYADERGRPFWDLVARVPITPRTVVDLGCGPGQLTAALLDRWPDAQVLGLDSSTAMIDTAQTMPQRPGLSFERQDLRDWKPSKPVDLVLSNAALQWIPEHRDLLSRFVDALSPTGALAFQVPGNFEQPSHRLLHELAADQRFARWTTGTERPASAEPWQYVDDLARLGCVVDAWETTYLHLLAGPDPVFGWISGTGARPVLQALPSAERKVFVEEYQQLLRTAYPAQPYGTVLPFRRIFVVARRG